MELNFGGAGLKQVSSKKRKSRKVLPSLSSSLSAPRTVGKAGKSATRTDKVKKRKGETRDENEGLDSRSKKKFRSSEQAEDAAVVFGKRTGPGPADRSRAPQRNAS